MKKEIEPPFKIPDEVSKAAKKVKADLESLLNSARGYRSQIIEGFEHMAELRTNFQKLQLPAHIQNFSTAIEQFSQYQYEIQNSFNSVREPLKKAAQHFAIILQRSQILDKSGWLPHTTTPFEIIDKYSQNPQGLSNEIALYYQNNWYSVKSDIQTRISDLNIDEEAKSTFMEALDAHEKGFYRCVCRVLFPEIERLTRIEFNEGKLDQPMTSQHGLRKLAGNLLPSSTEPVGHLGLNLYIKLTNHLYQKVETYEDLEKITMDKVPNRHAAIHGLITYKEAQNSLNTIFITDYIFQVIDFWKKNKNNLSSN